MDGCLESIDQDQESCGWKRRTLPPGSYVVKVHRLYAKRVRDALLNLEPSWLFIGSSRAEVEPEDVYYQRSGSERGSSAVSMDSALNLTGPDAAVSCRLLVDDVERGRGKDRRGYQLLLLNGVESFNRVAELHPMARQNVSWCSQITHQTALECDGDDCLEALGVILFDAMVANTGFQLERDSLRVDTCPLERAGRLCLAIQDAALLGSSTERGADSFARPLTMTKSALKCSHRMTVIICPRKVISERLRVVWAVSSRLCPTSVAFHVPLNDRANAEMSLNPVDPRTGFDLPTPAHCSVDAPVSRAFYKLKQVWDDLSVNEKVLSSCLAEGVGIDLGASPGGWTQVLARCVGMTQVLSIDNGILAHRVEKLPQVTHFRDDLTSVNTALEIVKLVDDNQPVSMLVCDACILAFQILDNVSLLVENLPRKGIFALPCAWVITLKLPSNRKKSVQRQIVQAHKTIPLKLSQLASLMYNEHDSVQVRYKISHLMANSASERTLLVMFEEK